MQNFRKSRSFEKFLIPENSKDTRSKFPEDSLKMFLRTFLTIDTWDSKDINRDVTHHKRYNLLTGKSKILKLNN